MEFRLRRVRRVRSRSHQSGQYLGRARDTFIRFFPYQKHRWYCDEFLACGDCWPTDTAFVEVSRDGGNQWEVLAAYNNSNYAPWKDGALNELGLETRTPHHKERRHGHRPFPFLVEFYQTWRRLVHRQYQYPKRKRRGRAGREQGHYHLSESAQTMLYVQMPDEYSGAPRTLLDAWHSRNAREHDRCVRCVGACKWHVFHAYRAEQWGRGVEVGGGGKIKSIDWLQLQLEEMGMKMGFPFHSFTNYSMNIFYKSLTVVWIALLLYGVTMIVVSIPQVIESDNAYVATELVPAISFITTSETSTIDYPRRGSFIFGKLRPIRKKANIDNVDDTMQASYIQYSYNYQEQLLSPVVRKKGYFDILETR